MADLNPLAEVMRRLREPGRGCPWDLEQDFASIAPYTIEEAYEVADAIARADWADLRGELGDLLLQVVYHSQMAAEAGHFHLHDVIADITAKMIRRHPHVFAEATVTSSAVQSESWERMKAAERGAAGALDGVALALPALLRAHKLQKRAARTGFDWPDAAGPRAKIDEELAELAAADSPDARTEEAGDLLFAVVNYLRHLEIEPEEALRAANAKFEQRFRAMEAAAGGTFPGLSPAAKEALWTAAKRTGG